MFALLFFDIDTLFFCFLALKGGIFLLKDKKISADIKKKKYKYQFSQYIL